jgi:hypothetical protein
MRSESMGAALDVVQIGKVKKEKVTTDRSACGNGGGHEASQNIVPGAAFDGITSKGGGIGKFFVAKKFFPEVVGGVERGVTEIGRELGPVVEVANCFSQRAGGGPLLEIWLADVPNSPKYESLEAQADSPNVLAVPPDLVELSLEGEDGVEEFNDLVAELGVLITETNEWPPQVSKTSGVRDANPGKHSLVHNAVGRGQITLNRKWHEETSPLPLACAPAKTSARSPHGSADRTLWQNGGQQIADVTGVGAINDQERGGILRIRASREDGRVQGGLGFLRRPCI